MARSKVGSTNPPVSDTLSNVDATTRGLLACGVAAGPLYLVVGFAQAFTRAISKSGAADQVPVRSAWLLLIRENSC